jgi:hypothetical protein
VFGKFHDQSRHFFVHMRLRFVLAVQEAVKRTLLSLPWR